jgi:hypothetical protein
VGSILPKKNLKTYSSKIFCVEFLDILSASWMECPTYVRAYRFEMDQAELEACNMPVHFAQGTAQGTGLEIIT